ncbi:uncharacterized protein LOC130648312 isoform X2 [Hydractinia symbiolongicarpus]|nr:uncharacterized protein LOC130647284 isoform X1 [Hydractinia symbiolongicarpus]XP_057310334.1 uncharacterized protein LOC130648312 isoform X2 [Hydractinia symbiolongicarpus]
MENDNWNPNAPVVCPYNARHVISVKRFQHHLIKCRKNYLHKDFVTCPYNAQHMFLREELKSHLAQCPDRVVLDADVIQAEDPETGESRRLKGNTSLPNTRFRVPDSLEDWDNEIEENIAKRLDRQEAYLRQHTDVNNKNSGDFDTESISSEISRSSSLYVEPVRRSEQRKNVSLVLLCKDNTKQREMIGRGVLMTPKPISAKTSCDTDVPYGYINPFTGVGRGLMRKDNQNVPHGIGRGVLKQNAMKFKAN